MHSSLEHIARKVHDQNEVSIVHMLILLTLHIWYSASKIVSSLHAFTLIQCIKVLALEVFTLDTNRPLDMDEPGIAGKVIIAIHSRVDRWCKFVKK